MYVIIVNDLIIGIPYVLYIKLVTDQNNYDSVVECNN